MSFSDNGDSNSECTAIGAWDSKNGPSEILEFMHECRPLFFQIALALKMTHDIGTERQYCQCRDEIEHYGRNLLAEWLDELSNARLCSACKEKILTNEDENGENCCK